MLKRIAILAAAEVAVLVAVVAVTPTPIVAAVGVIAVVVGETLGALGAREAQKLGLM